MLEQYLELKKMWTNLCLLPSVESARKYMNIQNMTSAMTTRMQSGKCQSCCYIKPEEEYYSSYCGNCFQRHELPNCVKCQHYRLKTGRCTNCGAIGPDDIQWTQWKDTCLDEDNNYARLIQPVLQRRRLGYQDEFKEVQDI